MILLIVFIHQLLCIENRKEQLPDMNFCHPLQENISSFRGAAATQTPCLQVLFFWLHHCKYWDELGLRRRLIVTSVVSLNFLLNSVKNLFLTELHMGHSIKKRCSSSILSLHALQNLSLAGIVGLQYLPVSIARLCALNLSFVKKDSKSAPRTYNKLYTSLSAHIY